jgi:SWIM/SEC-C metal-binding protein
MSKLGTKAKPAVIRVQEETRGMELYAIAQENGWQVIIGIEPDKDEDITDLTKLLNGEKNGIKLNASPSRNAACPCGSGKQYKRCCGK